MRVIDNIGYHEVQHRVAEKLESFVVLTRGAAVSKSLFQEADVVEFVAQRFREPDRSLRRHSIQRRTISVLSKCTVNEILAINGVA